MSFDVYLQSFHRGEFSSIPRQQVCDAFGLHLTEAEPDFWQVHYDDANSCDVDLKAHDTDPSMVHGLTVHRPCCDVRLWDALASILTLGDVVLYFPGGRAPLVAHSAVTEHLPLDMLDALGPPVVVTSGREILHEIHGT